MSLADIKHQPHAQRFFQQAVGRDRVPHAYIFHGPDGVGKEMFARGLAQLLLCETPVDRTLSDPEAHAVGVGQLRLGCGACDDCRAVAAETHPDLHLIYRQLNREHPDADVRKRKGLGLGVDVLRHFVIDKVGLKPLRGRAKVFVIREADGMNVQAQNALLKTLEEPPGTTFLILLATALDELLPTTQSRCQVVRFDALPTAFVRAKLDNLRPGLPANQLEWYAKNADGSIGQAVECVDDELFALNDLLSALLADYDSRRTAALTEMVTGGAKSLGERYRKRDAEITDTEATRRGLKTVFRLAAGWYADALRAGAGGVGRRFDTESPAAAINRIAEAERQLDLNANTQLVVETLSNDLCGASVAART
ncbi:MAG: DNA polymerase III subunit [Planctomycetota bacterium]